MQLVATRVDERLVHGQVMTSWSKLLQLKRIVIVDNLVAADDFMKTILEMSAPSGIAIDVYTVEQAAACIAQEGLDTGVSTMLLFKGLVAVLELQKALHMCGAPTVSELNIGNLGSTPEREQLTKNVFVSPEERAAIRTLCEQGVRVFLQMLPTDTQVEAGSLEGLC